MDTETNFIKKNPKTALELLRRMKKIRFTEEQIAEKYPEGRMRCPTHLCIGQEAVSAAVGLLLRRNDFALGTHRSHGAYLSKGGDLKKMLAEIYGKAAGCSKGRGGSMHLTDRSVSFMGSTSLVGGTIPVAVGLALSIKLRKTRQVSCVFFGDAAVEEGVFYESVNFAVLKKLPVLFICENNFYSVYSPLAVRQPKGREIYKMVRGFGCPSVRGDGNNAIEAYQKAGSAIERVRKGKGPVFFEFKTYRWREHCGPYYDNDIGYRAEEEFISWKKRDPVLLLQQKLLKESALTDSGVESMDKNILKEIKEAFEFAENSPFPSENEIGKNIYCGG
ncbi:MAG: acetoin dehydrogenase [Elusimicrobia bacterium GWC2_51_8]|nr:MAG: acetoin dehydrogenase [Elusimicrobia bacterium GWA2_51_34]OGR62233.1 MAG: acetoin dehydrogenase [Elusimicrobia bacterium GWC2_51_8]OGR88368.1 MAG: acetoin dehydrogenase [Elusimicrobia bacterium GWF2_52_66]HAF94601.1 acetoin dehydrogenase [Elusimicrobiota bacterium]HCE98065.1 acetoin dehydrogenase [Elusimicrobiota bacterium]